jgi:kynureninase
MVEAVCRRSDVKLVTPTDPSRRAGTVSAIPADPVGASQRLAKNGVVHSLREGLIRMSPHFYTSAEEIERAVSFL